MFEKKRKSSTDAGWFSLSQMHAVFNLTPQAFAKSIRPLLKDEDIRDAGQHGKVRIHCRAAINAYAAKQAEKAADSAKRKADPLLAGANSPALERYREHRAGLAELDVKERTAELVPLNDLWPALERFAGFIRRAGETLVPRFGNEAADILNDAINDAEQMLIKERSIAPGCGAPHVVGAGNSAPTISPSTPATPEGT